jgi:hypothetical protein
MSVVETLTDWTEGISRTIQNAVAKAFADAQKHENNRAAEAMETCRSLAKAYDLLSGSKQRFLLAVTAHGLTVAPTTAYDYVQTAKAEALAVSTGALTQDEAEAMGQRAKAVLGSFAKLHAAAPEGTEGDKARKAAVKGLTQTIAKAKPKGLTYEAMTKAKQQVVGSSSQAENRDAAKTDRVARKMMEDLQTLVLQAVAAMATEGPIDSAYFIIGESLKRFGQYGPSAGAAVESLNRSRLDSIASDLAAKAAAEAEAKAKATETDPEAVKAEALATILTAAQAKAAKRDAAKAKEGDAFIAKAEAEAEAKAAEAAAKRSASARKAAETRKANAAAKA